MSRLSESSESDKVVDQYHPFSVIGFVVLLISILCCLLAIVNPYLTFLPLLVAIGAATWLGRLHLARAHSGRLFTVIALLTAITAFSGTETYRRLRFEYLCRVAESNATRWLDLVIQGQVYEPYQLMQSILDREPDGTDLRLVLGDYSGGGESPVKLYAMVEPEVTVRQLGEEGADFDCEGVVAYYRKPHRREEFDVVFKMKRRVPGEGVYGGDRVFAVRMHRQHCLPPWHVQWHVATVENRQPFIPRQSGETIIGLEK